MRHGRYLLLVLMYCYTKWYRYRLMEKQAKQIWWCFFRAMINIYEKCEIYICEYGVWPPQIFNTYVWCSQNRWGKLGQFYPIRLLGRFCNSFMVRKVFRLWAIRLPSISKLCPVRLRSGKYASPIMHSVYSPSSV